MNKLRIECEKCNDELAWKSSPCYCFGGAVGINTYQYHIHEQQVARAAQVKRQKNQIMRTPVNWQKPSEYRPLS